LEKRGNLAAAIEQWRLAVAATHPEAAFDSVSIAEMSDQTETA
jgi:hypothetical protein